MGTRRVVAKPGFPPVHPTRLEEPSCPCPEPVICFGQQPCGIFPRRFLFAKMQTARNGCNGKSGGRIVFFLPRQRPRSARDHDRFCVTVARGAEARLNFQCANKLQTAVLAHSTASDCAQVGRRTRRSAATELRGTLRAGGNRSGRSSAENVADFCLQMYRRNGFARRRWKSSVRATRSSGDRATAIEDYFLDVEHENEVVRARRDGERLLLHKGGDAYITLALADAGPGRGSARRATAGCAGCNRSSAARITSPGRGKCNI